MFNFFKNIKKIDSLQQDVATLQAQVSELNAQVSDGQSALAEVRELHDRLYPLFAQGAEANAALIEKVARVRIKYPKN